MSEYDDWKQENDRWEAYLYPNGVLRNKLGITKAAKWHKMEREFVAARNAALRPNTGLTTGNVGEELFAGTTSACAENTLGGADRCGIRWNYLRVRGEYVQEARTILNRGGTTSACAENTLPYRAAAEYPRNYLRVRGEYIIFGKKLIALAELPPRARRIR